MLLPCVLEGDRLSQRGTEALIRMNFGDWGALVDLVWLFLENKLPLIPDSEIIRLCRIGGQTADAVASGIRNTMLNVVQMLHDPTSSMLQVVSEGLRAGKLVVIDLSLMRGRPATALSSVLLRYLFQYNVDENTKANSKAIPIIALIEEAQKVLEGSTSMNAPFVEWVKEGRKYDLGAVLVTQQPGAIDQEITSQADNMFVFHLLSAADLKGLQQANGHFGNDILATLLNEPIEGQGVFYTTADPKLTYPIPFRALNFGSMHARLSDQETSSAIDNYASRLTAEQKVKPEPSLDRLPTGPEIDPRMYPNAVELSDEVKQLAAEVQADPEIGPQVKSWQFPKFVLDTWVKKKVKTKNREQLVNGIITVINGLYGYGWREEQAVAKSGNKYQRVVLLDRADGIRRLQAGENPFVPGASEIGDTANETGEKITASILDDGNDIPF